MIARNRGGFTLIELMIVIAVLGILATISVLGVGRFQADARDSQRAAKMVIVGEALEAYYDKHGEYPSCNAVTAQPTAVTSPEGALAGINTDVLRMPRAAATEQTSIRCTDITIGATEDYLSYLGDGSADCSGNSSCLQFVLKYEEESSGAIKELSSRRQTPFKTVGTPVLNSTNIDFDGVSLAWTATKNTTNYRIQYSTTASFVTASAVNSSGLTQAITGLIPGTQYYFRVAPTIGETVGNWSNVISPQTLQIGTVASVTPVVNSGTQITVNWSALTSPNPASYTLRYSTTSGMASPITVSDITSTNRVITGLNPGITYYFQVQGVHPKDIGNWSTIASATTTVPAPAAHTMSVTRTWNALAATSNAVCPAGTPEYRWTANGSIWQNGTAHKTVSYGLTWNTSVALGLESRCVVGGVASTWTSASNNTQSHSLGAASVAYAGTCAERTACWSASCPATYTTSGSVNWIVSAPDNNWSVNSWSALGPQSWTNPGQAWGNGYVQATVYCNGPWGQVTASNWGSFGYGCVPTIQYRECYP